MPKKILFPFLLLLCYNPYCATIASAQGGWYPIADYGGGPVHYAIGFSIGTKGYVGLGGDASGSLLSFWEWDQGTNAWTQKSNFSSPSFVGTAFSIGLKGYVGGAGQLWEWDQATNTWISKAANPGAGYSLTGFSIGTKGYLGTGYVSSIKQRGFWEWDQATDTWTQRADFGGTARHAAVSFSIGTKGYIGTGFDNDSLRSDFWEWDQTSNVWTQMPNFPGPARQYAVGFSIGTDGYIGTGTRSGPVNLSDFWKWDGDTASPTYGTWSEVQSLGLSYETGSAYSPRTEAVGFSIGSKGYVGTGYYNNLYRKDFWEFNPDCKLNVLDSIGTILCGSNVTLHALFIPANNNIAYTWSPAAWLNNANISNPVSTPTVTTTYTILAVDTVTKCRAGALKPVSVKPPKSVITGSDNSIFHCVGASVTLNSNFTPISNDVVYSWSPSASLNSTSAPNPVASPTTSTTYSVIAIDTTTTCWATGTFSVTVNPAHLVVYAPNTICQGNDAVLSVSGGANYSWSTGQSGAAILVTPMSSTTYSVTGVGCIGSKVSDTARVWVRSCNFANCSNMDFEEGDFTGWTGLSGYNLATNFLDSVTEISWSAGLYSLSNDTSVNSWSAHTIISIDTLDPYSIDSTSNLPDTLMTTLAPGGSSYSVRLGNTHTNGGAEGLRIPLTVTAANSIFKYQSAFVFQDAGHPDFQNPGFMANVYDLAGTIIPYLSDTIHAFDPGYSFHHVSPAAVDPFVVYKRWTVDSINLSAFVGQKVILEFVNFDCNQSGHWGYTYLDIPCISLSGINQNVNYRSFSVYPNPTSGKFLVLSPEAGDQLTVTNILGVQIFSQKMGNAGTEIDLSKEKNGIYFVQITSHGSTSYAKVILRK